MAHVKPFLLSEFDELVCNRTALATGLEHEFQQLLLKYDDVSSKNLEIAKSNEELKSKLQELQLEISVLITKLNHARSQISHEIKKRQQLERNSDALEHQISVARELLSGKGGPLMRDGDWEQLTLLNNARSSFAGHTVKRGLVTLEETGASLPSPADISFDRTEDDANASVAQSWKKLKKPIVIDSKDHSKSSSGNQIQESYRQSVGVDLATAKAKPIDVIPNEPGCLSESKNHSKTVASEDDDDAHDLFTIGRRNGFSRRSPLMSRSEYVTPEMRRITSGNSFAQPQHEFISRICFKPETCISCGKKMKFGRVVMKCKECHADCHVECKSWVPLPCISIVDTSNGWKTAAHNLLKPVDALASEDSSPRCTPKLGTRPYPNARKFFLSPEMK